MAESSALKQAHDEIVDRLRELLDEAYAECEKMLVPVGVPRRLQDALREVDRLEGQGRDWADAERSLTDAIHDAEGRLEEAGA